MSAFADDLRELIEEHRGVEDDEQLLAALRSEIDRVEASGANEALEAFSNG